MTSIVDTRPRFRMRESGDRTDEDGCTIDADGVVWCQAPALERKLARLEAEQAARPETAMFKPAQRDRIAETLAEPTPEGGTLDALAEGIWADRNRK